MDYNYIDIFIAVVLAYGTIRGLMKGFLVEIASLLALILGVWGAIHFSDVVGAFLSDKFDWNENYISLSAFVITFLGIVIIISTIGKALTSVASIIALGWLNRLLGGVFGLLKFGIILSITLMLMLQINSKFEFIESKTIKESLLLKDASNFATSIVPALEELEVNTWWDSLDKAYEEVEDAVTKDI